MHLTLKTMLTGTACAAAICAAPAFAADFNIPGGDLKSALGAYMNQTGVQLIVMEDAIKGARTNGVKGSLSESDALTRILSGTGFRAKQDSGAVVIVPGRGAENLVSNLQLAQANPTSGRIEEVLVTARRREEAVQNIPISITALSAEDLKSYGVRNFADLEGVVPGLNMGGGGNGVKKDSSPFIRGVGQRETKVTLDPAVATYIDGIYIGRAAGAMLDVTDVQTIQVLRGPQGTLFGNNATGGAISVMLKKPTNQFEASVSVNIGNYGRQDISGIINIPIIDEMLAGRLFVSSMNSNGYFTNIVDNTKWGGDNRITGIAQLRFTPTDNLTFDLLGERTHIRETPRPQKCNYIRDDSFQSIQMFFLGSPQRIRDLCAANSSATLPPSQFASDLAIGDDLMPGRGRYWVDTATLGLTGTWDIGNIGIFSDVQAKSISAWRQTQQIADEDLDAMPDAVLVRLQPTPTQTVQWSQEVTLSANTLNERLFLSTGFYWFREKTPHDDLYLSAGIYCCNPLGNANSWALLEPTHERLKTDNRSYAWFGQADFDITSQIELTAGIRWTTETHWSRYEKAALFQPSVTPQTTTFGAQPGIVIVRPVGGVPVQLKPIFEWQYGALTYGPEFVNNSSTNGQNFYFERYVLGAFAGDELTYNNNAWTPMASVKYKASESVLNALSLDEAMVYATYSQGFHSGGVTAGAIDYDLGPMGGFYNPGSSGNPPCPAYAMNTGNCQGSRGREVTVDSGYGTADPQTFAPEKVVNYELGVKASALDSRLQMSAAAFYMNYTDMQVTAVGNRFGVPIPYIENVGKAVIKGFELEAVALPTPQWRVVFNGSYTDADIKEWMSKQLRLNSDGTIAANPVTYFLDRSDERMPRVPRWQFFTSTEYNFNLPGGGTLTPSVGVRFSSSIYHGFDRGSWTYTYGGYYYNHGGDIPPSSTSGANAQWRQSATQFDPVVQHNTNKWATTSRPTAFLDARIAWISENGNIEAALWGKNLTNKEDYLVGGIPLGDVTGAVGQVFANPRTFGITATYHFGE